MTGSRDRIVGGRRKTGVGQVLIDHLSHQQYTAVPDQPSRLRSGAGRQLGLPRGFILAEINSG